MTKFHVKKGDEVVVIAGSAKGRRGTVRSVLTKKSAVVLESADTVGKEGKKDDEAHEKRQLIKPIRHYQKRSQNNPQGTMLWLEGPIHISNVMLAERFDARTKKADAGSKQ